MQRVICKGSHIRLTNLKTDIYAQHSLRIKPATKTETTVFPKTYLSSSHRWLGIALEQMREGVEHQGLFHAGRCRGLCLSKCFLFQRKMPQFDSNDCDGPDYREHNRLYQKTAR